MESDLRRQKENEDGFMPIEEILERVNGLLSREIFKEEQAKGVEALIANRLSNLHNACVEGGILVEAGEIRDRYKQNFSELSGINDTLEALGDKDTSKTINKLKREATSGGWRLHLKQK